MNLTITQKTYNQIYGVIRIQNVGRSQTMERTLG